MQSLLLNYYSKIFMKKLFLLLRLGSKNDQAEMYKYRVNPKAFFTQDKLSNKK